ncbi:MAG: hypothetical protein RL398_881 [Planctomycetota bacterium]
MANDVAGGFAGGAEASIRTCVVVCYWTARSQAPLLALLRQLFAVPAGAPFEVLVVCNGGDVQPLRLPADLVARGVVVLPRENRGWNLGAWEHGWRAKPECRRFLFLQAECRILGKDWLRRYQQRLDADSGVGLVGEVMMWAGLTWEQAEANTRRDLGDEVVRNGGAESSFERQRRGLQAAGIEPGTLCEHLVCLVLYADRQTLQAAGGFRYFGDTYEEAIRSEIGMSRAVASMGLRLVTLGERPFAAIGHPQWTAAGRLRARVVRVLRGLKGLLLGRRG